MTRTPSPGWLRRLATLWLSGLLLLALLAAPWSGPAAAWAQGSSDAAQAETLDNSQEYALDPAPSREPPLASRLAAGALVVAGAFVVGVVAAGTATGGLVAAGAAAWLYAAMP